MKLKIILSANLLPFQDVLRYRAMHESSVGLWNDSSTHFKSAFEVIFSILFYLFSFLL
jgi:hypothetical protein